MSEPTGSVAGGAALSLEDVRRVARLARLELSDERAGAYREELAAILGYVERLRGLSLEGVEPLVSPIEAVGPLAADEPGPMLTPAQLLAMAPEAFETFVRVPKVLGEGSA